MTSGAAIRSGLGPLRIMVVFAFSFTAALAAQGGSQVKTKESASPCLKVWTSPDSKLRITTLPRIIRFDRKERKIVHKPYEGPEVTTVLPPDSFAKLDGFLSSLCLIQVEGENSPPPGGSDDIVVSDPGGQRRLGTRGRTGGNYFLLTDVELATLNGFLLGFSTGGHGNPERTVVIVPRNFPSASVNGRRAIPFNPSFEEISRVEAALENYLAEKHTKLHARLRDYYRQFQGLEVIGEKREVSANFFVEPVAGWKTEWVSPPADGVSFSFVYNLKSGTLRDFEIR